MAELALTPILYPWFEGDPSVPLAGPQASVPVDFPNPLEQLDDEALFDTQLVLELSCGRAKAVLKDKHRGRLCSLAQILKDEANHRDRPSPVPPFKA